MVASADVHEQGKDGKDSALAAAEARAQQAEAELAALKAERGQDPETDANRPAAGMATASTATSGKTTSDQPADPEQAHAMHAPALHGIEALREDSMMAHLLDGLNSGQDIGHYGRLTFVMIARHFLSDDELMAELTRDGDFSEGEAAAMLSQVKDRGYSPPRRNRIMEWQQEQDFAIIPNPDDPDCGNVYRSLHFPQNVYDGIEHYREEKQSA